MGILPLETRLMLSHLTVFVTGFISVFALGFQSRNVNHGNYGWAAGTSVFVGLSQAALWSHITGPEAGMTEALVYALSGAIAIVSSMYVHERFIKHEGKTELSSPRSADA